MIEHLKQASDKYPEADQDRTIHPISKTDANIITEIIELFKKMQFSAAVDILKNFKKISDEDTLQNLMELNVNIGKMKPSQEGEKETTPLFQRYLKTCGRRIDLYLLIHFNAIDLEIKDEGTIKYCIELNPTPKEAKQVPYYANEFIVYETAKERDEIANKLDLWFQLYRGLFIE
jgi:hypothetical protein